MRRREFITLMGGTAAAWPLAAGAQQPERIRRIGLLTSNTSTQMVSRLAAFREELREHGYRDGQNIILEARYAEGNVDRLPA